MTVHSVSIASVLPARSHLVFKHFSTLYVMRIVIQGALRACHKCFAFKRRRTLQYVYSAANASTVLYE